MLNRSARQVLIVSIAGLGPMVAGCAMENGEVYIGKTPPSQATQPSAPAAYQTLADRFIALATTGDIDGMARMLSPNEIRNTGPAEVTSFSRETIVPFFRAHPKTAYVTVSSATDSYGSPGLAFYGFATDSAGQDRRPFAVYVVRENGTPVIGSASVDHFVNGRHG